MAVEKFLRQGVDVADREPAFGSQDFPREQVRAGVGVRGGRGRAQPSRFYLICLAWSAFCARVGE